MAVDKSRETVEGKYSIPMKLNGNIISLTFWFLGVFMILIADFGFGVQLLSLVK